MRPLNLLRRELVLAAIGLGMTLGTIARAGLDDDRVIPLLKTKTATYTNVTITTRTAKEVLILHAGGAANVYLEDLAPEEYAVVGYTPPVPTTDKVKALANESIAEMQKALGKPGGDPLNFEPVQFSPMLVAVVIAVSLLLHLFYSFCLMLICRKAGAEPGALVWVPILQVFPMFRAAGMSGWWVLGMLVPMVNLVVVIVWCFNIVNARGKSIVWAIFLILPFTNLIAWLYLAFSSADLPEDEAPPRLPGLAVRTI